MTLACEVAYSKLAEVVTLAYFNDEDRVGQQFVADLEAEVWSKSLTFVQNLSILVKILNLKFRRDFEADAFGGYKVKSWSRF